MISSACRQTCSKLLISGPRLSVELYVGWLDGCGMANVIGVWWVMIVLVMLSIVCGDVCGITLVDGLGVLGEGCMVVN